MKPHSKSSRESKSNVEEEGANVLAKKILRILEKEGVLDVGEISKRCGLPEEEVNLVLKCMIKLGMVKYYVGVTNFGRDILKLPLPPE